MMDRDDEVRYSYTPKYLDELMEYSKGKAFRKKIDPCPYCEPNCNMFEKPKFAVEWDQEGIVREIVFVRNARYSKKGYAVMVSACPRCEKISFHHRDIHRILRDSWANKEIVQAEIDAWEQETLEEWNKSLCKRCAVEKDVEEDKFGYTVKCKVGKYCSPKDPLDWFSCDKYIPAVPNTCYLCGLEFTDEEHPDNLHIDCAKKKEELDRVAYNEWLRKMHELGSHLDKKEK